MVRERRSAENLVCDPASVEALEKAERDGVATAFDRMVTQDVQCKFGTSGVCCRMCHMGPCRITAKAPRGICGADADTIVARNYLREVVSGTAAHSDHARHLVLRLKKVAEGKSKDYEIRDEAALIRGALLYSIDTESRSKEAIALELAAVMLGEFTEQEEALKTLQLAPIARQEMWQSRGVEPTGIDRTVVESMHRTHMGVDHDYENIMLQAMRTALADGWGGSRIASIVGDILFGTPQPVRSDANLGVLGEDTVNIVVHGHEPALSEMLALAVRDPEIANYARKAGAKGVTLAGICCTANEILMRHGIPVAGNFLQQELAIVTGGVEMMIIDVQCCMPSLPEIAAAYHTEIISTAEIAKTIGATHVNFDDEHAFESAKSLICRAVDNYQHRNPSKLAIPAAKQPLIAGFSVEAIKYMLGGSFRRSFRPLNDAIIAGRIRGVAGIVGCNNPKTRTDSYINILTQKLIEENVLVLKTGCAALASGKAGRLTPETALEQAGAGLREVCEAIGIPPILHMGSCVDNSRILEAASEIVFEGGLGDDLSQIPAVGVAPEWMSEKAVAIGCYFVASGIDVILGQPFHVSGSDNVSRFLGEKAKELFGAAFYHIEDPLVAAEKILELLEQDREKLGINKKFERKLFDMKDRRELRV